MHEKDKQRAEENNSCIVCKICENRQESDLVKLGEEKPNYGNRIPLDKTYGDLNYIHFYSISFREDSQDIKSTYSIRNDGMVKIKHEALSGTDKGKISECTRYLTLKTAEEKQKLYKTRASIEEVAEKAFRKYNEEHKDMIFQKSDTLSATSSSKDKYVASSKEKTNNNFQQHDISFGKSTTLDYETPRMIPYAQISSVDDLTMARPALECCPGCCITISCLNSIGNRIRNIAHHIAGLFG